MRDRIQNAFEEIRADGPLLEKTAAHLRETRIQAGEKKRLRPLGLAVAFGAMAVLLVGVLSYHLYFAAATYVSIDVNPSMELTLNRLDRVIGTYAFNAEGEGILEEIDLNGKKYDDAVSLLVAAISQNGYFGDNPLVAVTVQTADSQKEQTLCGALRQSVNEQVTAMRPAADVEVYPVTAQMHKNAHECHMSPAKYLAIQELLTVDEGATLEEYSDASIHQIRRRTQQCQEEHSGAGQGSHHFPSEDDDNGLIPEESQNQGRGSGHASGHGHGYHGG